MPIEEISSELAGAERRRGEVFATRAKLGRLPGLLLLKGVYKRKGDNLLKTLREQRGLGIRELARLSDCSPSYIVQLESGARNPSVKMLRKLARSLKVSTNELLTSFSNGKDLTVQL